MAHVVDSPGVYRLSVVESGFNITKNGYPKWVAQLKVEQKFVTDKDELNHFELDEPAWVDYSPFDQVVFAHMVLFKANLRKDENCTDENVYKNYEQLQLALGWDGTSFSELGNEEFVGKSFQGRIEANEYQGKIRYQLAWIDSYDANPGGGIKTLDISEVKKYDSLLVGLGKKKKAVATAAR